MLDPILLQIAKSAIRSRFDNNYVFDKSALLHTYPFLSQKGAAFVTLTSSSHQLRGCIGSLVAHQSLLEDVIHNAISAAFHDSRFTPLSLQEFSDITIEVSVLSTPEILEYQDFDDLCQKIRPSVDGLLLKHGMYQGTFLPQVWEQLPTQKQFLQHLSIKAGANPTIYNLHPDIYRYGVEAIEANSSAVTAL